MWRTLEHMGFSVTVMHSFLTQKKRAAALSAFKNQKIDILLSTDVAGRGIDIKAVDLVINYDLPKNNKDFVHRVGRASRGGKVGLSISLITQYDLERVKNIEELLEEKLELEDLSEESALENMSKIIKSKKQAEMDMNSKGEEDLFEKLRKRKKQFRESIQAQKKFKPE